MPPPFRHHLCVLCVMQRMNFIPHWIHSTCLSLGNYFSNLNTAGGASSKPHRDKQKHKQNGFGSNNGNNNGNNDDNGASNNPLSGLTGLLTNNPLTDAVNGVIGDGSLSRKVCFLLILRIILCESSLFKLDTLFFFRWVSHSRYKMFILID